MKKNNVNFIKKLFIKKNEKKFDFVIYATYGIFKNSNILFKKRKIQIAEKILFDCNPILYQKSLVIIDGPFTGFDYHLPSKKLLFGSAKFTNRWETKDENFKLPKKFKGYLNQNKFRKFKFTNFNLMKNDAAKYIPCINNSKYLGSNFTLRVVEDDPKKDHRIAKIINKKNIFYVFSGKVVSAPTVANQILEKIKKNV